MKAYKASVQTSATRFQHFSFTARNFKSAWKKMQKYGVIIALFELEYD